MNSQLKEALLRVIDKPPEEEFLRLQDAHLSKSGMTKDTFQGACLAVCAAQGNKPWCDYLLRTAHVNPLEWFEDETGMISSHTNPLQVAIRFFKIYSTDNKNIHRARMLMGILHAMLDVGKASTSEINGFAPVLKHALFLGYTDGIKLEAYESVAADAQSAGHKNKKAKTDETDK